MAIARPTWESFFLPQISCRIFMIALLLPLTHSMRIILSEAPCILVYNSSSWFGKTTGSYFWLRSFWSPHCSLLYASCRGRRRHILIIIIMRRTAIFCIPSHPIFCSFVQFAPSTVCNTIPSDQCFTIVSTSGRWRERKSTAIDHASLGNPISSIRGGIGSA